MLVTGMAVVVMAVGATGCGGGRPAITTGASSQLTQRVQAVTSAAASGNRPEAMAQLAQLQADVATLLAQHQISAQRAADILMAASAVSVELAKLPAPTPSPTLDTTPTPEDSSTAVPPGRKKHGND
jgi:hypothetical protein